jgi:dolichol kinase
MGHTSPPLVESYLWTLLAVGVWIGQISSWSSWIWLSHVLLQAFQHHSRRIIVVPKDDRDNVNKVPTNTSTSGAYYTQSIKGQQHLQLQGIHEHISAMSLCSVMFPALLSALVGALDGKGKSNVQHLESPWWCLSVSAALLGSGFYISAMLAVTGLLLGEIEWPFVLVAGLYWFVCANLYIDLEKSMAGCFYGGELKVVCMILALVIFVYLEDVSGVEVLRTCLPSVTAVYVKVALAGFLGCTVICAVTETRIKQWWIRLVVNIAGPLIFVELSLFLAGWQSHPSHVVPLFILWLYDFLTENESGYPRYFGLLYWCAILAITSFPTAFLLSLPVARVPVVVTRKWFHLVAVLLFGPVIAQMPQLMTLSFAIAICVLMVLETLRRDLPFLQQFYVAFVDSAKDNDEQIIVSHVFLIFGCAAPLWLGMIVADASDTSLNLLLAEFGVISIGIGDAMGAVVGKLFGRHTWGVTNQRTYEGSVAMWVSMLVSGALFCNTAKDCLALILATTFTTLLEAFTIHLDNLVLPLAGSTILLLLM